MILQFLHYCSAILLLADEQLEVRVDARSEKDAICTGRSRRRFTFWHGRWAGHMLNVGGLDFLDNRAPIIVLNYFERG